MKKIFSIIGAIILTVVVSAQVPQKMNYQCVIRNAGGDLVANHTVGIRISILQGSPTGTAIFRETYSPLPVTDANGLVTIEIGGGTPVTGTFPSINWSSGPYYLKTETDPAGGTNYSITGTSQLLSVPYAQFAKTAENGSVWSKDGSNIYFPGRVGLGVSTFNHSLSIHGTTLNSEIGLSTDATGSDETDGLRIGVSASNGSSFIWNCENTDLFFGTNSIRRMTIAPNGFVNIGPGVPAATLSVNGTVKLGTGGKIFSEISEVTGTTGGASTTFASVSYPAGYTRLNTRVLSAEINANGDVWVGIGFTNGLTTAVPISYNLSASLIYLFYPDVPVVQGKPFRMLLMKVE